MKKRITAIILIAVFAMLALFGCKTQDSGKNKNGEKDKGKDTQNTAMGRYMEEEIPIPELAGTDSINEVNLGMVRDLDGNFILIRGSYKGEKLDKCTGLRLKEDHTWEDYDVSWLNDIKEKMGAAFLSKVLMGQDGKFYAVTNDYSSGTERVSVYRQTKEGKAEKLNIPQLDEKTTTKSGYEHYGSIDRMDILEDGSIVISDTWIEGRLFVFSGEDGSLLDEIETASGAYFGAYGSPEFKAKGNKLILRNLANTGITIYDMAAKETAQDAEYPQSESSCVYDLKEDGTLVAGDSKGIHILKKDGTLFETVVDGSLNSMSMVSLTMNSVYALNGEQDEYYVEYSGTDLPGGMALMRYYFDSSIAAVPEKELTVYSLYDNKTIRQAVSMFQKNNPDVRVSYTAAMEEEGGNVSDYIRALNTELLSDNGADVIILDGLPVDSYIEKGVLADLSDILEPMIESGELHESIVKGYKTEKGTYQIPSRFNLPLFIGSEKALKSTESLELITGYIKENPKEKYFSALMENEIIENLLAIYNDSFFTEDGTIVQEAFIKFLEDSKLILDHSLISGEDDVNINYGTNAFQMLSMSNPFDVLAKRSQVGLEITDSMSDFFLHENMENEFGCMVKPVNNSFIPLGTAGLNSASSELELGKEFIGLLVSEDLQSINVYDGFPINTKALNKWIIDNADTGSTMGISSSDPEYGDMQITGECPPIEKRQEILAMLLGVDKPLALDEILKEMILTESAGYFDGTRTAKEAADAVMTKVNTYLSE